MISRFHYITHDLEEFSHPQLAEFACKGGADWVQLRAKNKPYDEWKKIAEETKKVCKKYGAKFIVNDNVFLAKEISADGVHLGKEDMNPKEARKILGNKFFIGGTANTLEDVKWLMKNKIDYIGIGPFRFSETKKNLSPVLGLKVIEYIITQLPNYQVPIIAIGGIKLKDVEPLMKCGIYGIAVSSAINLSAGMQGFSDDKIEMTKKFLFEINASKILQ